MPTGIKKYLSLLRIAYRTVYVQDVLCVTLRLLSQQIVDAQPEHETDHWQDYEYRIALFEQLGGLVKEG
jgi:hypothetical protein